ncbi:MAG: response regulator transcription factor, partial [Dehalococcoidia bacterium]
MASVLYVTPDSALGQMGLQNLSKGGHDVSLAKGGMEALRALHAMLVDVLVLDTAIADVQAVELCERLRQDVSWQDMPVVFLAPVSSRWLPDSLPLREGRDGLVCKPFTGPELKREVERVLGGMSASGVITLAEGVEVERSSQEVRGSEGSVSLTPTEFRLLEYLAERPTSIVSSGELLEKVWEFYPGTGSSELVRSHIRNVRAKLRRASGGR